MRLREAMAVEDPETQPESARLARVLRASSHIVFKVWRLPSLASVSTLIAVLAIAGLVVWQLLGRGFVTWPGFLAIARWAGLTVLALGLWATARALVFRESVRQSLTGVYLGAFGVLLWPMNRLHLHLFDRFYLQQGRLDRIVPPTRRGSPPAGTSARVGEREEARTVQRWQGAQNQRQS